VKTRSRRMLYCTSDNGSNALRAVWLGARRLRMGWLRSQCHATDDAIHAARASHMHISASHVRSLYHRVSLPLLACQERQHREPLAQIAKAPGGVIVALAGLAPQGGEPQIWFIRALTRGFAQLAQLRRRWAALPPTGTE
jgi:hypothetical protein